MKYFLTGIIIIVIIIICITGFLYLNPSFFARENAQSDQQAISAEQVKISERLNKLHSDINNLQDILSQQVLLIQKIEEENLYNSAQINSLDKKFQDTITRLQQILAGNQNFANAPGLLAPTEAQTNLHEPSYQAFSPELFNNPEFARLFQEQVDQAVKETQKKEREEQMAQFTDRINEMIKDRLNEFAKAQNLNEYQQQELNRLVMERSAKTMELFTKMRTQEITGEEFRNQQTSIRNENNNKIKQVLLPEQYEEYSKIESQFSRGGMMMGGGGRNQPRPQQTPSPP